MLSIREKIENLKNEKIQLEKEIVILENSGAVVGVRVERTHEAEAGGAVEFTRVEQNGRNV